MEPTAAAISAATGGAAGLLGSERHGARQGVLVTITALVAAGVVILAFVAGANSRDNHSAEKAPSAGAAPQPGRPAAATPGTDPERAAEEWLRAYRTVIYTDPTPTAWTDRVRPAITGDMAQQIRGLSDASGGAEWVDFVAQRCQSSARDIGAIVPAEAPRSPTSAFVQVSADVVTTCAGNTPDQVEPVAATVEVQRGRDGLWRVAKRLF